MDNSYIIVGLLSFLAGWLFDLLLSAWLGIYELNVEDEDD